MTTDTQQPRADESEDARQGQPEGRRVSLAAGNKGAVRRVSYAADHDRGPRGSVSMSMGGGTTEDPGAGRRASALNVSCHTC